MSGIRVTYSGLISFAIGLVSIVTGLIFTLIVTRQLTSDQLGTWTLIGGLLTYIIISESIISYWVTREVAQGIDSGKTAIFASGVFSVGGIAIYLIVAFLGADQFKVDRNILYLSSILIPVIFLDRTLSAINLGWKPQAASYGSLVFETVKIPVGLILVYFLHLGVKGAILTSFCAYVLGIIILLIYARHKIRNAIKIEFIKKWMKLSWLTYYPQLANMISKFDILIYTVIVGSVTGLAYYTVAFTMASMVGQSGTISRALYSKLLEGDGNKREFLQENLIRVFYFMIPLTAISITFARSTLFALNPIYEIATLVAIIISIRMIFVTLTGVLYPALVGIERVDFDEKATFKDYFRSRLFSLPTIMIIQAGAYLIILSVGLLLLTSNKLNQIDFVTYWSLVTLITEIPFTVYLYLLVRKNFLLQIDYRIILKYCLISIVVFGSMYFLSSQLLEFKKSIFEFLPNLLSFVLLGTSLYLSITYFTDQRTKKLFNAIIKEIKNR